jgi:hypothetical protein
VADGGSPIIGYKIYIRDRSNIFEEYTGSCPDILTEKTCDVTLDELLNTPFNLLRLDKVVIKIKA